MASLTITALYSKKIIFLLSIFLGLLIVSILVFMFGKGIFAMIFPPEPDPALVAFGKLPELSMTEGNRPPTNVTYKIETVSGDLKELKAKLKVFAIDISTAPKFGDLNGANVKAKKAQFAIPAISVADNVATYIDSLNNGRILTINTITGDLSLKSDYLNNTDLITNQIKDDKATKIIAQTFMSTFGLDFTTYPKEKINTVRYKIDGGKLTEAVSSATTNLFQVNFNRTDLDAIPVVYPSFDRQKVSVLASATDVVGAKALISKIQEYRFSTYPLKGIKKAYADLVAGKAIYNKELIGGEFPIRDVSLAYLDTDLQQPFLQPVYVFSGDDGLAAYVGAVADIWINTKVN